MTPGVVSDGRNLKSKGFTLKWEGRRSQMNTIKSESRSYMKLVSYDYGVT